MKRKLIQKEGWQTYTRSSIQVFLLPLGNKRHKDMVMVSGRLESNQSVYYLSSHIVLNTPDSPKCIVLTDLKIINGHLEAGGHFSFYMS